MARRRVNLRYPTYCIFGPSGGQLFEAQTIWTQESGETQHFLCLDLFSRLSRVLDPRYLKSCITRTCVLLAGFGGVEFPGPERASSGTCQLARIASHCYWAIRYSRFASRYQQPELNQRCNAFENIRWQCSSFSRHRIDTYPNHNHARRYLSG